MKTLIENIVSNVYFLSVVPSYHSHSVGIYGARIFFQGSNLGERVGKWTEEVPAGRKISDNPLQMICTRRTHRLTPSLIDHVGTIRDGSTVCHDMAEGRTCDDIRDVLGLPRDPSGDNKRTTRTGTCQWTTLYCAEIALPRISLSPPSSSCLFLPPPIFDSFILTGRINLIFSPTPLFTF